MGGLFHVLFGVFLYFFIVGLVRYYASEKKEIYFDGLDVFIAAFYVLFGDSMGILSYALWLLACCFGLLFLSFAFSPLWKILFDSKYYWYKSDEK